MSDLMTFWPLFGRDEETIRANVNAVANQGLLSSDPDWVDTREGSLFHLATQGFVIELARVWDRISTEVVAAALHATSWEQYLDTIAQGYNVARKVAVKATGQVTFTGTNGTIIGAGTQVSVVQTDPDVDPATFETTAGGTISGGTLTLAVQARDAGAAGNVGAGSITLPISPLADVTAITNAAATSGGADTETDEALKERLTLLFEGKGSGTEADYKRWALAQAGVGRVTVIPVWAGEGTVQVIILDVTGSPLPESTVEVLQDVLDPPKLTTRLNGAHTFPVATVTVDSTTGMAASGSFRVKGMKIDYTGKTATTFTGCSGGSGVVADDTRVEQGFDQAKGLAPLNHVATVQTAKTVNITVTATVSFKDGYSLTGTGGSKALKTEIENAIKAYVDKLQPGDDVIFNHVEAQFFTVEGVLNVSAVQVNGGTADVAIASTPYPEVARISTITLS